MAHVRQIAAVRAANRQLTGALYSTAAVPSVMGMARAGDSSSPGGAVAHSITAVQEEGVDEADLVKTDGRLIFTMDSSVVRGDAEPSVRLRSWQRADDGSVKPVAALRLGGGTMHGLHHVPAARRVAMLVEQYHYEPEPLPVAPSDCGSADAPCLVGWARMARAWRSEVVLQVAGFDDQGALSAQRRLTLSGRLIASRQVGGRVVLVTAHQPSLPAAGRRLPADSPEVTNTEPALQAEDVLPTLQIDGGAKRPLVSEADCLLQPGNASQALELTSMTVIDLNRPDVEPVSRCFVGGSEALYMSQTSLYIATTRWSYPAEGVVSWDYPPDVATDLHKFALDDTVPRYRGSASVAGHLGWDPLRKPYRMSEHDGVLRVLTFTGGTGWGGAQDAGRTAPSPATLTLLRERADGAGLQEVSRLPNAARPEAIGKPGEQVYGVRFVGDRGYVVTFRQTDPLYVLDLSDPADPRVAGALEVPGYSEHLYPLPGRLLLGVGREADAQGVVGGFKATLFDVGEPARPQVLGSVVIGDWNIYTALDATPHGIAMMTVGGTLRAAIPMLQYDWQPAGDSLDPWRARHGLLRLEVDLANRLLTERSFLEATATPYPDLGSERALFIADHVYHLSAGRLSHWLW